MISALNTAVNGLNNAYERFDISANKIAGGESAPAAANTGATTPSAEQAGQPANAPGNTQNDTAQQLINANIASYDASGNIAVIKTDNKIFQSLLNIVS